MNPDAIQYHSMKKWCKNGVNAETAKQKTIVK